MHSMSFIEALKTGQFAVDPQNGFRLIPFNNPQNNQNSSQSPSPDVQILAHNINAANAAPQPHNSPNAAPNTVNISHGPPSRLDYPLWITYAGKGSPKNRRFLSRVVCRNDPTSIQSYLDDILVAGKQTWKSTDGIFGWNTQVLKDDKAQITTPSNMIVAYNTEAINYDTLRQFTLTQIREPADDLPSNIPAKSKANINHNKNTQDCMAKGQRLLAAIYKDNPQMWMDVKRLGSVYLGAKYDLGTGKKSVKEVMDVITKALENKNSKPPIANNNTNNGQQQNNNNNNSNTIDTMCNLMMMKMMQEMTQKTTKSDAESHAATAPSTAQPMNVVPPYYPPYYQGPNYVPQFNNYGSHLSAHDRNIYSQNGGNIYPNCIDPRYNAPRYNAPGSPGYMAPRYNAHGGAYSPIGLRANNYNTSHGLSTNNYQQTADVSQSRPLGAPVLAPAQAPPLLCTNPPGSSRVPAPILPTTQASGKAEPQNQSSVDFAVNNANISTVAAQAIIPQNTSYTASRSETLNVQNARHNPMTKQTK